MDCPLYIVRYIPLSFKFQMCLLSSMLFISRLSLRVANYAANSVFQDIAASRVHNSESCYIFTITSLAPVINRSL